MYRLRWAPGHSGVLGRGVDSVAKLRTVVEWARSNPDVEKCSYRVEYRIDGPPISECPAGHALSAPARWQPYRLEQQMRLVSCADCPGHYVTVCPICGTSVFDPPPRPDCGPPTERRLGSSPDN